MDKRCFDVIRMKYMKRLAFATLVLTLIGAGCWSKPSLEPAPLPATTIPPSAPTAIPEVFQDPSGSIKVTNLKRDQLITNPFVIKGTAVAFESAFSWKLADESGWVLAQGSAMAAQPDAGIPGPFAIFGFYDNIPKSSTGELILFEASAKDGTPTHVVNIPVKLVTAKQAVNVYLGNNKKNPNAQDCSLVYPVTRYVAKAEAGWLPYVAVDAMLGGPTAVEKLAGYFTSLPGDVKLIGAQTETGAQAFNFNQALQRNVGGSCRVQAIRSQINVTSAKNGGLDLPIAIEGKTEDVLQP